jgi:5-methyltetrahydropteroyltriglutamate--homocysteine methyltransferase
METTVLGYPRIGGRRELKKATEGYWAGRISAGELAASAAELRRETWETLRDAGLSAGAGGLEQYFTMARGADGVPPLEMTKWFDTNYHYYLVPELGPGTELRLAGDKPLREYAEAAALGIETRPVVLGPLSFLLLSKPSSTTFDVMELLDPLLDGYADLLRGRARESEDLPVTGDVSSDDDF